MTGEAPAMAKWLLRCFGCSPNNEAIVGDLDERYRQGRSYLWYWRQVFLTIVASFLEEIRHHKLLTLRAIAVGCVIFVGWQRGFNLTRELLWYHERLTVALQFPEVVLFGVSAGWIVARLHHQSQKAMVLAYVACFAGVQTLWLVSALLLAPSGFYPFIYAVIFFNPIIYAVLFLTMTTVSILMGGGVLTTQR
jgi:hypothetical protein